MTAVAPVVIDCKGIWIGWSGLYDLAPDEVIPEADPNDQAPTSGLTSSQVSYCQQSSTSSLKKRGF